MDGKPPAMDGKKFFFFSGGGRDRLPRNLRQFENQGSITKVFRLGILTRGVDPTGMT